MLYTVFFGGLTAMSWVVLDGPATEGWWAWLSRYFQQLLLLALGGQGGARRDFPRWRGLQLAAALVVARRRAGQHALLWRTAGGAGIAAAAAGCWDILSYEGWWHWFHWQRWGELDLGHLTGVGAALLVGVRRYYLAAWLYHSLRSLDTGLVYRLRLWPRPPVRVALGDYLHPWSAPVVGAWEDLAP